MIRDLYEFFLCPVHGIFRVDNWPIITASVAGGAGMFRAGIAYVVQRIKR